MFDLVMLTLSIYFFSTFHHLQMIGYNACRCTVAEPIAVMCNTDIKKTKYDPSRDKFVKRVFNIYIKFVNILK